MSTDWERLHRLRFQDRLTDEMRASNRANAERRDREARLRRESEAREHLAEILAPLLDEAARLGASVDGPFDVEMAAEDALRSDVGRAVLDRLRELVEEDR